MKVFKNDKFFKTLFTFQLKCGQALFGETRFFVVVFLSLLNKSHSKNVWHAGGFSWMENKFERKCTFLIDDHYITEIVRLYCVSALVKGSADINETKHFKQNLQSDTNTHTHTHIFILLLASFLVAICPFFSFYL